MIQITKAIYLLIAFMTISFISTATTYYVDATLGNDDNNGLSQNKAWKTIDRISDQSFAPGDKILFKRGEVWKGEQLEVDGFSGTQSNLIIFGAYPDQGVRPVISTIVEHAIHWNFKGNNLWKASNPPNEHPERLWVNGSEILRANSQQELDGINFFWLYDAPEDGNLFLFSKNDPSNDKISYTNDQIPLYLENTSYIRFENLDLQGGWTSVFINSNTSHIQFNQMNIGKYATNGIDIQSEDTSTPNHISVSECNFDSDYTLDYSMSKSVGGYDRGVGDGIFVEVGKDCEFWNNKFVNWGHASINIDGNPDGRPSVRVSYISVHDNFMTSPNIAYGGRLAVDDAHHCEVYNNRIYHTSVQTQLNGYSNHYHHNIIEATSDSPVISQVSAIDAGIGIESYANTDIHDNIYEFNVIKDIEGPGIAFSMNGDYDIYNNFVRNNIILNCGTVHEVDGIGIKINEDESTSKMYGNFIQNNLIYNENTENTIDYRGVDITNVAGFNDLNSDSENVITNNISGDPNFVSETDFHLKKASIGIDAGIEGKAKLDFDGNEIPKSKVDIGLYEFQKSTSLNDNTLDIVSVFPNPTTGIVVIPKDDFVVISICNSLGQKVDYKVSHNQIDLSYLPNGIYFLNGIWKGKMVGATIQRN